MKRLIYGLLTGLTVVIILSPNAYGVGGGHGVQNGHHHSSDSDSVEVATDTSNRVITQIKESAEAIKLSVSECTEGSGASNRSGSFIFAGSSYPCDVAEGVAHMLSVVPSLLNRAQSYPKGSKERDEALRKAQYVIDRVYVILADDMGDYLEVRGFTAKFGVVMRDMWAYFLFIKWLLW